MATKDWASDSNGFFQDPLQWQGGSAPSPTDTADLSSDGGADYTVVSRSGLLGLALGGTETVGAIQTASNATLQIVGDVDALDLLDGDTFFKAAGGTGGGSNAGTIVVQDAVLAITLLGVNHLLGASATLEIGSTFNNTGTVSINGQPHLLGILDADQSSSVEILGPTTLVGGGNVIMSNEKLNFIHGNNSSAVLTNVDNTISGAGYIGQNGMSFINDAAGVVDAEGSNRLALKSRDVLINDGLLTASNHGALVIYASTVANTGTIGAMSDGKIVLQFADIQGGAIESTGNGYVVTNPGVNLIDGSASTVTIGGQVRVRDGTSLSLEGSIDNTGKFVIDSIAANPKVTTLEIANGGVTLSGGGEVISTPQTDNRFIGASESATLTNVDNRIALAGNLGEGRLNLINEANGRIIAATSGSLVIDTGANVIMNAGVISDMGKGGLIIKSAVDNTGLISAIGANVTVDGAVTGSGTASLRGVTLDFASSFAENVTFLKTSGGATSGVLELADSVGYTGKITGFSKSGQTSLDLGDIAFGSKTKATYSGTAAGGVLTVTDGTDTATIHLVGNFTGSTFTASSDGHGGTTVVDPTSSSPAASTQQLVTAMAQMPSSTGSASSVPIHSAIATPMLGSPSARAA